jgi:hypothetical protein
LWRRTAKFESLAFHQRGASAKCLLPITPQSNGTLQVTVGHGCPYRECHKDAAEPPQASPSAKQFSRIALTMHLMSSDTIPEPAPGPIVCLLRKRMEHGMECTCYSIEKHQDQWVVLACGARVLICNDKKMAIMIARRAANMSRENYATDTSHQIADAHSSDRQS